MGEGMNRTRDAARASLLVRYDNDEAFRARIAAMYLSDRPRFISALISLAYSLGATRPEAVEFANAVTRRIKDEMTAPKAGKD